MDIHDERKEKVLAYICSKKYIPLKFGELMVMLEVPREADAELLEILEELCDEGKIYITKRGRYMSVDRNSRTFTGVVMCNAKHYFGFVRCDEENEEDIFIPGDKLGYAVDGDRVLVKTEKINDSNHHREGYVLKVLERKLKLLVGVVTKVKNGTFRVLPDNRRIYYNVRVKPKDMMGAKLNDRVAVEITEQNEKGKLFGKVTAVLGASDSLASCMDGIIIEHGIKTKFDDAAAVQAGKIEINEEDFKNRTDLRNKLIFTIDGDDARDFDDAVSAERKPDGSYELGVHIADVTHYVKEGSPLDTEAFERGTSVYLPDRVIPMLPEKLSNGVCSLNPHEPRLTLSVTMSINPQGRVLDAKIEKSVIESKERMTYSIAGAILDGDAELRKKYAHIVPTLELMDEISSVLWEKRKRRGSIDFDFPESKIIMGDNGEPADIVRYERNRAHRLIEEFMIAANETVAEYAWKAKLPFVYRVHEPPSSDRIKMFASFMMNFGLSFGEYSEIHPKMLQEVLDKVKDTPAERMIATEMLHSLMRAEYKTENMGHFGLAAEYYCHFTSPIRRYPDLTVHRILKKHMDKETDKDLNQVVLRAALHSTQTQAEAEETERDADALMQTAYMSRFIGQRFNGTISAIAGFGVFVELENTVEGLIRIEDMRDDYYRYNEDDSSLIGTAKKKIYRIGDTVSVVVVRTDIILRQITFVRTEDAVDGKRKKIKKEKNKKIKTRRRRRKGKKK